MSQARQHDETIRLMLTGGIESEIQQGFVLIAQHFREPVCGWLKRSHYTGISGEDLSDIWQDTLRELLKKVRDGKYDGGRKVFSDLCRIIKTNTIDQQRRHKSREKLLHEIGAILRGTQTGQKWQQASPIERREIQKLIREAAIHLSPKQRQVLEAFLRNLPESYEIQELRRFVSELTGVEETVAAVKGSLAQVRLKLRAVLRRKGYGVAQTGDDNE